MRLKYFNVVIPEGIGVITRWACCCPIVWLDDWYKIIYKIKEYSKEQPAGIMTYSLSSLFVQTRNKIPNLALLFINGDYKLCRILLLLLSVSLTMIYYTVNITPLSIVRLNSELKFPIRDLQFEHCKILILLR